MISTGIKLLFIYLFIMISYTKYMSNEEQTSKKTYIYIIQPTLYNLYIIVT